MKEQEYKEGVGNPFDSPVPGQQNISGLLYIGKNLQNN